MESDRVSAPGREDPIPPEPRSRPRPSPGFLPTGDGAPGPRHRPGWLLLAFLLAGCASGGGPGVGTTPPYTPPGELDAEGRAWVRETLSGLSLREAVGQLIIPWMPGAYTSTTGPEFEEYARYVEEAGVGGVSVSIGLPHSYGAKLNALQARARIPLLVTSDFENGGPGMRINHSYALPTLLPQGGGTSFPPTMAFGAIGDERYTREYGRITALEARAVGVHLNFAPVLDVNSNPLNPVINTRSFGEDPEAVARLGAAYLAGARAGGVLTTAKHFPGHGDTRTDSHVELPVVNADRGRLEALELVPFRRAVGEGVDAVMTAHVAVPGILGPQGPPATLSPFFLTELLREDMGFEGLVLLTTIFWIIRSA
ncbi:MAG: glycoside hydrolase family 3 protein, partial [Longimicrobiales bacterium]